MAGTKGFFLREQKTTKKKHFSPEGGKNNRSRRGVVVDIRKVGEK